MDDARSREDQEALGDFIIAKVAELTSDPKTCIHASIAGGRKTMTFYLGYAMSLFGRIQDELSHVLVVTRVWKGCPFLLPLVQFEEAQPAGALPSRIWMRKTSRLCSPTFLCRQRSILPEATLELMKMASCGSGLINLINLGMDSSRIRLRFFDSDLLSGGGRCIENLRIKSGFSALAVQFYHMVAESTLGRGSKSVAREKPARQGHGDPVGNLLHLYGTLGLPVPLETGPYP